MVGRRALRRPSIVSDGKRISLSELICNSLKCMYTHDPWCLGADCCYDLWNLIQSMTHTHHSQVVVRGLPRVPTLPGGHCRCHTQHPLNSSWLTRCVNSCSLLTLLYISLLSIFSLLTSSIFAHSLLPHPLHLQLSPSIPLWLPAFLLWSRYCLH